MKPINPDTRLSELVALRLLDTRASNILRRALLFQAIDSHDGLEEDGDFTVRQLAGLTPEAIQRQPRGGVRTVAKIAELVHAAGLHPLCPAGC